MKILLIVLSLVFVVSCSKPIQTKDAVYKCYGLINEDEEKDPNVIYKMDKLKFVVGILGIETVFLPIYIFGFDLYCPVSQKSKEIK